MILLLSFFAGACSSTSAKKAASPSAAATPISVDADDIDDALLGTWLQTGVSCSKGELTAAGKEISTAFRSGISVAKVVVTSDKTFWDMKDYKDLENADDFCQVSVEEKWNTSAKAPNVLIVSGSDTLVTGNGQVVCDKSYSYPKARTHKYEATEKELRIFLNSSHDAMTGVSTKSRPICKEGLVVLSFERDSADE